MTKSLFQVCVQREHAVIDPIRLCGMAIEVRIYLLGARNVGERAQRAVREQNAILTL